VISFFQVKFFDQVCPLSAIKTSNHIESFVVKC
jgi:hypothetical protein